MSFAGQQTGGPAEQVHLHDDLRLRSAVYDAEAAADAAAAAFAPWSRWSAHERADMMEHMAAQLDAARADLIDLAANELGASKAWIDFNVDLAVGILRSMPGLIPDLVDLTSRNARTGISSIVRREAAGVCLAMVPWNAPVTLGVRAVAAPLMCGNTVVMKGSELCPETHVHLVDVLNGAGLPDGVLTCVLNAPDEAHDTMVRLIGHPCVRRINFTGSTRVGREVAMEAARHLKPVLLELSGKAPLIVLEDADLDAAVDAALFGAFFNQGQICMSTEWIIVIKSVADSFVEKMQARLAQLQSQPDAPFSGRMISPEAAERVMGLVQDAVSNGARLLAGGECDGAFMPPTLLDGIASHMRVYHEETFGPLASVMRVHDAEEAVSIANDSDFGLNAAVFTKDRARADHIAGLLEYGVVQINGPTVHDDPAMPFGGLKLSGHGRFGGPAAINEFTETRWIATHDNWEPPAL